MDDGRGQGVHVVHCQAGLVEDPQDLLGAEGRGVHNVHQRPAHAQLRLYEELVVAMRRPGPRHGHTVHKADDVGMAIYTFLPTEVTQIDEAVYVCACARRCLSWGEPVCQFPV